MIVWLEDRVNSVITFKRELETSGLPFQILSSIAEVVTFLDDEPEVEQMVFVVDIMLAGVEDLRSIQIADAPTGKGNWAGQVFVQRYLRAPGSRFLGCPVLFLTEREVDEQLERDIFSIETPGNGRVEIYKKYSQADLAPFLTMLSGLSSGTQPREASPDQRRIY
jgi:hypothetical protein